MWRSAFDPGSSVVSGRRSREVPGWLSPALLGAMLVSVSAHGVPVIQALRDLMDVRSFVSQSRARMREAPGMSQVVEAFITPVEEARREPEREVIPAPTRPVVAPVARPEAVREARAAEPPPATAQAGTTLTAPDDRASGDTLVQGRGPGYVGGLSALDGTARTAVSDPQARGDGVPGGKGSASASTPPPASTEPDRSRIARATSSGWNCPFPPEADEEGKDSGTASIMVTVRPDGSVQSVKVVSDSGTGFGAAARRCALGQRFEPSFDRTGQAVVGTTAPFTVRFTR
ncbi:MAG: hypothetical protein EOO75_20270 [Myxococcales bacterium]|nr:MAG: hypothetical protein EOO75_20270 [Myxococcales bacterium]